VLKPPLKLSLVKAQAEAVVNTDNDGCVSMKDFCQDITPFCGPLTACETCGGELEDRETVNKFTQSCQDYVPWERCNCAEEDSNGFPINEIPLVFRNLAKAIAIRNKSEDKLGVISLPLIGCFAAALGQGVVAHTNRYAESYRNLYVYCSVGSGGIKSEVIREAEAPILAYQKELYEKYAGITCPEAQAELLKIKKELEVHEFSDDPDEIQEIGKLYKTQKLAEQRMIFCPVKLDDVTPESIVEHVIRYGRAFVCSDEAATVTFYRVTRA